jgi:glycine hydroxymethyltransferase
MQTGDRRERQARWRRALVEGGLDLVTGGTDNHMVLVDLRKRSDTLTGADAEKWLEQAGIVCNKNGIPGDPRPPRVTSGVRLGAPATTTRGFGPAEFRKIGHLIVEVVDGLAASGPEGNAGVEATVKTRVKALCKRFPIYPGL